jgi:hypothetical protein
MAARLSFDIGLTNATSHDYTTANAYRKSMYYNVRKPKKLQIKLRFYSLWVKLESFS